MHAARRNLPAPVLLAGLAVTAFGAQPVAAQATLAGRVVDDGTGLPVADALVYIDTGADSTLTGGAATNPEGHFRIEIGDREEVILSVSILGYQKAQAFFALPVDGPVVIRVSRDPIVIEGFTARADRVEEYMDARLKSLADYSFRTATVEDLRDFDQTADIDWFLPAMTVGVGTGCDDCYMMMGPFKATYSVDGRGVSGGEFRSYRVGEICRVEVMRRRKMGSRIGVIRAYTCGFLEKAVRGDILIPPSIFEGGGQ